MLKWTSSFRYRVEEGEVERRKVSVRIMSDNPDDFGEEMLEEVVEEDVILSNPIESQPCTLSENERSSPRGSGVGRSRSCSPVELRMRLLSVSSYFSPLPSTDSMLPRPFSSNDSLLLSPLPTNDSSPFSPLSASNSRFLTPFPVSATNSLPLDPLPATDSLHHSPFRLKSISKVSNVMLLPPSIPPPSSPPPPPPTLPVLVLMVSMSSIFRFPLAMQRFGGSSFLLCYTITLLLLGLPLLTSPTSSHPLACGLPSAVATLALLLATQTALLTSYSSLYLVSSLEPWLPYSQCQTWQDPSPSCPPLDQLSPNSVAMQLSTEEFWLTRVLGMERTGLMVEGGLTSLHPRLALHLLVLLSLAAALLCLPTRSLARLQAFLLLAICLLLAALTSRLASLPQAWQVVARLVSPRWEALADPGCWQEATLLACLSGHLHTGALKTTGAGLSPPAAVLCLGVHLLLSSLLALLSLALPLVTALPSPPHLQALGHFPLVSLSQALASLDSGARPWSQAAFLLLTFLGLSTLLSLLSVPCSLLPRSRTMHRLLRPAVPLLCLLPGLLLCTTSGPGLHLLLSRWGTDLPSLLLATVTSTLLALHLCTRPRTSHTCSRLLQAASAPAPILYLCLAAHLALSPRPEGPLPLPSWAPHLCGLLASLTVAQVPLAALLHLLSTAGRRSLGLREGLGLRTSGSCQKLLDTNVATISYKNFEKCDFS